MHLLVHSFLLAIDIAHASVPVYGSHVQQPHGTAMTDAFAYHHACAAGYDGVNLIPPPLPHPPPSTFFGVQLQTGAVSGLSIPQRGSFFGFSIELSAATQVLGLNSSSMHVPFLNLMANIEQRAGGVQVHVGSNAQDYATLVGFNPDNSPPEEYDVISANLADSSAFIREVMETITQISSHTNVHWYRDVPCDDTGTRGGRVAEFGKSTLGDYLVGLQTGIEQDFYLRRRGYRSSTHTPDDDQDEFGQLTKVVDEGSMDMNKGFLVGPNLAEVSRHEDVWDTFFVMDFNQNLAALAVKRHPVDNCHGISGHCTAQEILPFFLTHKSGQRIVSAYLDSIAYAQAEGLSFLMLETSTAPCGSFPGLSDSFAAALWAVDYGLQMAYANFSHAMFHVGGQHNFYDLLTPPATNQSTHHLWTIGPVYYSSLFVAEALGPSNQAQVLDLQMNGGNEFTPGYAIYENGQPTRVALINFVDDNSGTSDYTASISMGGTVPPHVRVKYLAASSVTQKCNITWAGQTFGDVFGLDGQPVGVVDVRTVYCDQINNVCDVRVPAPGAALVFLSDPAALATRGIIDSLGLARAFSILIAVCAFVCIETLLSYAVTGHSPLALVQGTTKNAR